MFGVGHCGAVVGIGAGGINHAGVTNAVAVPVRGPDPGLGHRVGLDAGVLAEVGVIADDGDVALAHHVAQAAVWLTGDGISVALVEAQVVVTVDEEHPLAAVVGVELDVVREGGAELVDDDPERVGHRRCGEVVEARIGVTGIAVAVGVSVATVVGDGVSVAVGVSVGVGVAGGGCVGVSVAVGISVGVSVGISVGVSVGVAVLVGVAVGAYVGVWVGVSVGTDVRAGLLLLNTWGRWTVREGVGVRAACGVRTAPSRSTDTMNRKIARMDIAPMRRPTEWLSLVLMR